METNDNSTLGEIAGQSAFPRSGDCINYLNRDFDLDGMSMRQYYAAMAMQAILSNSQAINHLFEESPDRNMAERVAEKSFHYADAMIKAEKS